jgi:KDO2-lipid IV(A) lauroyltransferase
LYHEGLFVPFFGRPACTHYGPAMLAIESRRPVITAFSHRTADGRLHLDWDPPLDIPASGTLRERTWELTRRLTDRIEAAVRRHPEQWFWVHKRWKNQPRPELEIPAWKFGPIVPPRGDSPDTELHIQG